LEDGYKAAAALESLTSWPAMLSQRPQSASLSADDLLQTVTAFQLAGGLRLGSLRYGSLGFLEVIGALNPLKTVKDGITENREINRKRDETRRLDEREREQQAMQHKEATTRESRASEQQQQSHALEVARLQLQAEQARFNVMGALIDRLPTDQQSVAAAQLLQNLMEATEAIANDARIDEARMLEQATSAQTPGVSSQTYRVQPSV
jgi:serine phosphatase RsbU (regulator of sigma subunit)